MSTDEPYQPIVMRDKYVCSDQDNIKYALGKVLEYAQKEFTTMYMFRRNGFYYMTDFPPEFKKRIATVYPGGRILLRGSPAVLAELGEEKKYGVKPVTAVICKQYLYTQHEQRLAELKKENDG